ncbi:hypothetical protein [Pseudomonas sp. 2]|nr:hypothetical protein [Pseudomonas sp. 2]
MILTTTALTITITCKLTLKGSCGSPKAWTTAAAAPPRRSPTVLT